MGFCPVARAAEVVELPTSAVELAAPSTNAPTLDEITITIKGNQIRVQNAEGFTLDVYNITGVKVATHRLDSDDKTITLNINRGIYIVKVGKVARRVNIL